MPAGKTVQYLLDDLAVILFRNLQKLKLQLAFIAQVNRALRTFFTMSKGEKGAEMGPLFN